MWIVGARVRMKLGRNMAESGANYAAGGEGTFTNMNIGFTGQ